MAKLTREQYNKFNAKCKNGFGLDLERFGIWGEKRCIKTMKFDDDPCLYEVIIDFIEETKNYAKIGVKVELVVNKLIPGRVEKVYRVVELKREAISDIMARKSVKVLQDLTANYTDDVITNMINELKAA